MKDDLPIVFSCLFDAFDGIIKDGAIFSKDELVKRGKKPHEHPTSKGLDYKLGTSDEVTLFVDKTFSKGQHYGSPFGPRLVFNIDLIFRDDIYVLPVDQNMYDEHTEGSLSERFEEDKCRTKKQKEQLLKEYNESDGAIAPEIHIPAKVELQLAKLILIYEPHLKRYCNRPELEGISLVSFGEDFQECIHDTGKSLKKAYDKFICKPS